MWLTEIEADRLRNLKAVRLELSARMTLIAGRNGQGKSSLLEAIFLLATGRSFRTRKLDELVAWDGGPLRVAGKVASRVGRSDLAVIVDDGERRLVANGGDSDLESFLGRVDVVDLTAERMKMLSGPPDERRRFLDRGIVGLGPSFLRVLGEYRRTLSQRNALLRKAGGRTSATLDAQLDAWDERWLAAAVPVHEARRRYAVELAARCADPARALFANRADAVTLGYRPSPAVLRDTEPARIADTLATALAAGRRRDVEVGHTCLGPHRDELRVDLDGVDLRKFGSAGQVRASVVVLKLAKLLMLKEARGESPIFLMDDFDSDLDEGRAKALAEFLHAGEFQTVVATSKESMVAGLGVEFDAVKMVDGAVRA